MAKKVIFEEGNDPFLEYIRWRIKANKNCVIIIVGGTGSGKSWAALSIGEELDDKFGINNIAFRAVEFMKLINKDFPPGSVLMFDEGGVDLGARDFMTKVNRILSKVLQTVRYKNHIIIITVPDMKFIDAHARKLAHMILITNSIDRVRGLCKLRPYYIDVNAMSGDVYNPHPLVSAKGMGIMKIFDISVPKPSVKLRHRYEKIKEDFGTKLYNDNLKEMLGKNVMHDLNENERKVYAASRCGVSVKTMVQTFKLSPSNVTSIRSRLRQKGYSIASPTAAYASTNEKLTRLKKK